MSIAKRVYEITRFCSVCRKQKGILGSKTYPRFTCAECVSHRKKKDEQN